MRAHAVLLAGLISTSAWGAGKDWPAAGGDLADDHYSTLTQIDTRNVKQLGGAWVHQFDGERGHPHMDIVGDVVDPHADHDLIVLRHGLLHIPEIPTSWFSTQRWLYLDPSWSSLFTDAYVTSSGAL